MNPDTTSGVADVAASQSAPRMDPQIKAQWVAALRSGEYKQGGGTLHNSGANEFCCLGVLCDLAVKSGLDVRVSPDGTVTYYDDSAGSLPPSVADWANLDSSDPVVAWSENDEVSLAQLNDQGETFAQLADRIENVL